MNPIPSQIQLFQKTRTHLTPLYLLDSPLLSFFIASLHFFVLLKSKKYEIATDEIGNPIKQDEKKGMLREFKKGDIFFNYGCLPVSCIRTYFLQVCVNH